MTPYQDALEQVLKATAVLPAEEVPLEGAWGCVLAEDVHAAWDLPPFDNSAMDGYAVRSQDGAGPRDVVARVFAGGQAGRPVGPGEAVRIMTGAPVPEGADAVVKQEDVRLDGEVVVVPAGIVAGQHVRRRGEDVPAGSRLLSAGRVIDASGMGVLATFGHSAVRVHRRPVVGILATGDELVPVEEAGPGSVVESNSYAIAAQVREAGGVPVRLPAAPDRPEAVAATLRGVLDRLDYAVTIAGASVGERDPVHAAFEELGVELVFRRVAMKPGKPVSFGMLGSVRVFSLPGNPQAAYRTFEALVRPSLLRAQGRSEVARPTVPAVLATPSPASDRGPSFMLTRLERTPAGYAAHVVRGQGSGRIALGLDCNGLLVVPPGDDLPVGRAVEVALTGEAPHATAPPVLCVVGPSGSGKTTLLERLLPLLSERGLRVAAIKRTCHAFDVDRDGKDSWRLRKAGAAVVALANEQGRLAVMTDHGPGHDPVALLPWLPVRVDLVLVEGFKEGPWPRIEVHRADRPRLHEADAQGRLLALVTDAEPPPPGPVPALRPGDEGALADIVQEWLSGLR